MVCRVHGYGPARAPRLLRFFLFVFVLSVFVPSLAFAEEARPYDVVVVGGGPSGFAAALSARQKGAGRVLVLEKRDGGSAGRLQTLLVEQSTIAEVKRLGVEVNGDDSEFKAMKSIRLQRSGEDDRVIPPKATIEETPAARPGARTLGMFTRRAPIAFVAIDGAVRALRDAALRTPGIDVVEGAEVVGVELGANGDVTLETARRDAHGKPIAGADATTKVRGRYVYDASGLNGMSALLGVGHERQGPAYPMVTAVFHDADASHYGRAVFTRFEEGGVAYRGLIGGGRPGETTVTFDLPPSVDAKSPNAVAAFAKSAAARTRFFGDTSLDLAKAPAVYAAQRTNADRVLVGVRGRERVMIGGDALVTGTPWTGLGFNLGVHTGVLFGDFYERAESARTPEEGVAARRWATARLEGQIAALHTVDRATHIAMNAPQIQAPGGKAALFGDLRATGHEAVKAATAWVSYRASRVAAARTAPMPLRLPRTIAGGK